MSHAAVHPGGKTFERVVNAAIAANVAVMIWPHVIRTWKEFAETLDDWFLLFFAGELIIRFAAAGFNPRRFVQETKWNTFDTIVITLAIAPLVGHQLPHLIGFLGVHLGLHLGLNTSLLRLARPIANVARAVHGLRHVNHLRTLSVLRVARLAKAARLVHGARQMVHLPAIGRGGVS